MDSEIDTLKQENHQLLLKIKSLEDNFGFQIEDLREELKSKEKEFDEISDKLKAEFKIKETDLTDRITALNDDLLQTQDENETLRGKLEALQKTIINLKGNQVETYERTENVETLKMRNDQLTTKLKDTQLSLETNHRKIQEQDKRLESKDKIINSLKEESENKDSCISQLQSRMREIELERQEEIAEFQQRQALYENQNKESLDPTKRGNSLFTELDDRRQKVEQEMNRLRDNIKFLTKRNCELQTAIDTGDSRYTGIIDQIKRMQKNENDFLIEMKKIKSESTDCIEAYRERLEFLRNEYKKKLVTYKFHGEEPRNGDYGELENIRKERDDLLHQRMTVDREVLEYKKQAISAKHFRTEAEAQLKILRIQLNIAEDTLSKKEATLAGIKNGNARNESLSNSSYSSESPQSSFSRSTSGPPDESINNHQRDANCNVNTLESDLFTKDVRKSPPRLRTLGKKEEMDCKQQ